MTQNERRERLIQALIDEHPDRYSGVALPRGEDAQRHLLRALVNLRPPLPASAALLSLQDAYLAELRRQRGVTEADALPPLRDNLCLWRGDVTTLRCDGVVNAANGALLGCFCPNHGCIDNAIHSYAGIQLRLACKSIMDAQGHDEPAGRAKITPAFNLPARYVLHTVGPIVRGNVTAEDRRALAACYRACLDLADQNQLRSLAFCCISTGEFHFPNELAARIAVQTTLAHEAVRARRIRVIFNVFKEQDEAVYRKILLGDGAPQGGD